MNKRSISPISKHFHHNMRIVEVDNQHEYKMICKQCNDAYIRWAKKEEYEYMQNNVLPQQRFTFHDLNQAFAIASASINPGQQVKNKIAKDLLG